MSQSAVKVLLRGGLGNQLFQYAAGFTKAAELGLPLHIDARQLPSKYELKKLVSRWPEQISDFNSGASRILLSEKLTGASAKASQVQRMIGDRYPGLLARFGVYANETNGAIEVFRDLAGPSITINAYCNSPSFFESQKDEIRKRIRDLRNPTDEYLSKSNQIESEQPLALHLRLGDYKNLESIYGRFDHKYYAAAVQLAKQISNSGDIWLFSDEPGEAFEMLNASVPGLRIAPIAKSATGLETLLLMSRCRGLVASNSSFSWWTAYMMNQEWPIIFPRPFFAQGSLEEPKDFLLAPWLQIGRQA